MTECVAYLKRRSLVDAGLSAVAVTELRAALHLTDEQASLVKDALMVSFLLNAGVVINGDWGT